ncbi:phosphoribosylformylglycinamidine synthase subunit PurQ [Candidatus Poribacteria bacterium]
MSFPSATNCSIGSLSLYFSSFASIFPPAISSPYEKPPGFNGISDTQETTLYTNDSGKFECRWVYLKHTSNGKCVFTNGIKEVIYLPVAHGEGKFTTIDEETLDALESGNQVVLRYVGPDGNYAGYPWDPNGSDRHIAGICDSTGRIFGLMPHPERHLSKYSHPRWTREELPEEGDGLAIFRNAVEYAQRELCSS